MDATTLKAYRFFRDNGGTVAGSLACARAERNRIGLGARVSWEPDWLVGSHLEEFGREVYDREPDECESATLYDADGNILGSLHCIDDADAAYRRLIEAELALEYLPAPGDYYVI